MNTLTDIDQILHPATSKQVADAFAAMVAMSEAIRELGRVPSGELYARVMGYMDIEAYNKALSILKNAGLVAESAHMLTWIGPKLEAK